MKVYYIDRKTQIRHFTDLSIIKDLTPINKFNLSVPEKENFVLQFVILPDDETQVTAVEFSSGLDAMCINTEITDKFGNSFTKPIPFKKDTLQPVFVILKANSEKEGTTQHGKITFSSGSGEYEIDLNVKFTGELVDNGGFNDIERLSRLIWLNSSKCLDYEIVSPYICR